MKIVINLRLWGPLALAICILASSGCCSSAKRRPCTAGFPRANAYRASEMLPPEIRRVAVLPLVGDASESTLEAGLETLEPVLHSELSKCDLFELTFISPEKMRQWTGQSRWAAEERLPQDFFQRLQQEVGCNAVLFSRLTRFQAYAPLQTGWNLKLVESANPRIWWSADEVFDAGQPAVAEEARQYAADNLRDGRPLSDSASILMSPARFGQYSISIVLGTLPKR
jgi:hypothetical protein